VNLDFSRAIARYSFAMATFGCLAAFGFAQTTFGPTATLDRMAAPAAVRRANLVGRPAAAKALHVSVSLSPTDPAAMEAYADRVSDPNSPDYRRFLTPAEVGRRFGPSEARVKAVASYLRSQGMTISLVSENRLSILAETTVAQAEKAFDTRIATYRAVPLQATDRAEFFSYTETPRLPAAFSSSVIDVGGLENATKPVPRALTPTQTLGLYKAAAFYSGGLRGQGRTLAISNFDGFRLSNVPLYYSKYALPTPSGGVGSNVKVTVCGSPSGTGSPQGEGDLDIQMVLGVAPLCNLTVYDGIDLVAVLTREVNDNTADVISESYGWNLSASTAAAAHNLHVSMTLQGITYLAASGDTGTSFGGYDYPDYEPEVLMVGGTVASADASGNRTSEVGWNGSGGGYSTNTASFNVLPSWQKGTGVPTNINKRLVPDLALNAAGSGSGAYPFYYKGSLSTAYNGTSFASPVLAGLLGIAEQKLDVLGYFGTGKKRLGRLQDAIYAMNGRTDVWYDVTSGSNGKLPNGTPSTAKAGWDTVTGWGTIKLDGFVAALAAGGGGGTSGITTGPAVYTPTSVSVYSTQGAYASGSTSSLIADDKAYYSVKSAIVSGVGRVATIAPSFTLPATATSATVTIVTNASAGTAFQLYVYNTATGAYDLLSSSTYTGTDRTFTVTMSSLSRYLSPAGTLKFVQRALRSSGTFTLGGNRFVVTAQ